MLFDDLIWPESEYQRVGTASKKVQIPTWVLILGTDILDLSYNPKVKWTILVDENDARVSRKPSYCIDGITIIVSILLLSVCTLSGRGYTGAPIETNVSHTHARSYTYTHSHKQNYAHAQWGMYFYIIIAINMMSLFSLINFALHKAS